MILNDGKAALRGAVKLFSTLRAFAAVSMDGTVVPWAVKNQPVLSVADYIYSTEGVFAAVLRTLVTWCDKKFSAFFNNMPLALEGIERS